MESKVYNRWTGVLENMEIIDNKVWKILWPDKNLYAQIMETEVSGTNKVVIRGKKWIVVDCEKELELE